MAPVCDTIHKDPAFPEWTAEHQGDNGTVENPSRRAAQVRVSPEAECHMALDCHHRLLTHSEEATVALGTCWCQWPHEQ